MTTSWLPGPGCPAASRGAATTKLRTGSTRPCNRTVAEPGGGG